MRTIPSPSGIRLVLHEGDDIAQLSEVLAPLSPTCDQWLLAASGKARSFVVTAARDAHVVGFIAVDISEGQVVIVDQQVSALSDETDDLVQALTEAAIDVASTPWGDVIVDAKGVAVGHLLRSGWRPTSPAGGTARTATLTLSGAGVQ